MMSGSVEKNGLWMSEVSGECADWRENMKRQQHFNYPVFLTKWPASMNK